MATQVHNPTLKNGSQGAEVKTVQEILNRAIHANLAVDGIFGPNTEKAVKEFQTRNNLTVDGIVGPQTWGVFNEYLGGPNQPTLSQGSKGEDVKRLQHNLNYAIGANLAVDGIFGPNTEKAVKDFQTRSNLEVDGIVGPLTWGALNQAAV